MNGCKDEGVSRRVHLRPTDRFAPPDILILRAVEAQSDEKRPRIDTNGPSVAQGHGGQAADGCELDPFIRVY